eukprot:Opistho-2@86609
MSSNEDASDTPMDGKKDGHERKGRRKINIEFIDDKSRRHITFSKRKAGIMKKAYELSTLTGTQVLLLVASETGHVYTFATPKLQPLITKPEGKNMIQSCLNAPDNPTPQAASAASQPRAANYPEGYTGGAEEAGADKAFYASGQVVQPYPSYGANMPYSYLNAGPPQYLTPWPGGATGNAPTTE